MGVAQEKCRGCNVSISGATAVRKLEAHGGYCRDCRHDPSGYELLTRGEEVCTYCKKKFNQH